MTTNEYYLNDVWKKTLTKLKETHEINDNVFNLYFSVAKLRSLEDGIALVIVPHLIHLSILKDKTKLIEDCLHETVGQKTILCLRVEEEKEELQNYSNSLWDELAISRKIDPSYNFGNFVIGRSNAQAQVAASTVAENLGLIYNPLFIYGNSGLGKTHLLNAIGNRVRQLFPNKRIGFVSGLDFVEGVCKATTTKKLDDFKKSFHDLDLLLVDDIQFIAGKEKTHEVFFSVFNDLVNNYKQVCLTADRVPSDIHGLEDRIISRFNQGLNVNIEAPEYETSINILKMKISNNIETNMVDDEVLNYIATNFSTDVRSLEGAVNRLLFYSINFSDEDRITLKTAMEAFKGQVKETKNELTINVIRKCVCDYYGLTKQQIISATRTKNIATARHIAMYLCRKLIDAPYKDIGNEFGKRDHSTVISACDRVEKLLKSDSLYVKVINEIEGRIK